MTVRVMVVDDQAMIRAGFVAIIDAEPDLDVVAEADDGARAVELAGQVAPDVVLMDIRMPGIDGLTATRLLTARGGAPRVLVLTTFDQDAYVHEALRAGASGFLLKDAQPEELLAGIRIVAAGDAMLAPAVTRRLIDAFAHTAPPAPDPEPLRALTPREREVLALVAAGLTNAEIADALGVTTGTVKSHVNAVLGKLGLRDRVQATILAYDTGLARPRGAPPAVEGHGRADRPPRGASGRP
ncbi:response regulator [Streptomyces sp. NPDC047821]|uniref:response regulator n=1 Tax=Streptomyces sp. NPDC047821 TaxID=3365488 RepID=UPI00372298F3